MSPYVWLLVFCCVHLDHRAQAITTKTIPLSFTNGSDSSQYVQIRSNVVNQGPRNLLQPHKNVLSAAQQTHILDDVQKNQRIHYHAAGPANLEDRQKSLFNHHAPTPPQNTFDQSHLKYANFLSFNSLSPPPLQTVVLSPQQTLPTTSARNDPPAYYRPHTHTDVKNSFTQPHAHTEVTKTLPQVSHEHHVLKPSQKAHYYQPPTSTHPTHARTYITDFTKFTTPTPRFSYSINPYAFETTSTATTSVSKSYLTKDANTIFAPLLEKPATSYPEKIIKEIVIKTNPEELIAKDRQKFFQQLLGEDKSSEESAQNSDDQTVAQNDLSGIRGQFEKEFLRQLKEGMAASSVGDLGLLLNSSNAISEFSLPDGQRVQISKDYNRLIDNEESGNKIKTIVLKQYPTTTPTPVNLFEELTKGVIPPGTDFEVIKRNKDGGLEEVGKLPPNLPQKKVTFVILEEQSDGTVKVQGVRGSEKESLQESGEEVDTIIRKIKEGELKLPPSTRLSSKQSQKSSDKVVKNNRFSPDEDTKSKRKVSSSDNPLRLVKHKEQENKHFVPTPVGHQTTTETTLPDTYFTPPANLGSSYQYFSSPSSYYVDKFTGNEANSTPSSFASDFESENHIQTGPYLIQRLVSASLPTFESSTPGSISDNFGLFHLNNSGYITNLFSALKNPSGTVSVDPVHQNILQFPFLPTTSGNTVVEKIKSSRSNGTVKFPLTDTTIVANTVTFPTANGSLLISEKPRESITKRDRNATRKTMKKPIKDTRKDNDEEESNVEETKTEETTTANDGANFTLSDMLKKEGFYAMARFLRQSGLDSILNDTGPFTLFVPTDKAFRTLLIQLGGPDKAEEKFKENPRLLSGLLLHHVIPGAFRVNTLQDEMTGVSLAGTQLRVNTYTTHDIEWNDITVVTVNGAKILDEKNIVIPQGIAHAIDRVMFPLPVGNLLQSLQADRENRYSNFLKILEESGLAHMLTGSKTFTLFAPLNRAFTHAEFTKIVSEPSESKSFVLRHVVPGALYSAGMKYYQVRDSMEDGQQVTLYKEAGKIKVNTAHVITRNIPATNGVVHAIDSFL